MKILYVSETYEPDHGGMPTLLKNFTRGLADEGQDIRLWTRGDRDDSYQENLDGVVIYRQRSKPFVLNPTHRLATGCRQGLNDILAQWQPDVIHIHIFPSAITAAAMSYARKHHIPVVVTNHAMPENYRNIITFKLPNAIEKILFPLIWRYLVSICNQATLVTTPTPTALGYLKNAGLKRPSQAISNGIDTDLYKPLPKTPGIRQQFHLPTDKPLLLYLGRLDGEKMVEVIINALPHLTSDYHLAITGSGNFERQLKELTIKLGLSQKVTFTGAVSTESKVALYQNADIFVIASPAELQSIVTLEAMSCGLPIVAVAAGALTELCVTGTNGLLFKTGNSVDLARQLTTLIDSEQLRTSYGAASRKLVEASHALHATIIAYEALYTDITGVPATSLSAAPEPTASVSGKI